MTDHTPGPWGCTNTSFHAHDYRLTRRNGSNLPFHAPGNDHSEQRANAALIAAAPELLAALEVISSARAKQDREFDVDAWYIQARAAIALAKGTE